MSPLASRAVPPASIQEHLLALSLLGGALSLVLGEAQGRADGVLVLAVSRVVAGGIAGVSVLVLGKGVEVGLGARLRGIVLGENVLLGSIIPQLAVVLASPQGGLARGHGLLDMYARGELQVSPESDSRRAGGRQAGRQGAPWVLRGP
jgi:hypothetical protein